MHKSYAVASRDAVYIISNYPIHFKALDNYEESVKEHSGFVFRFVLIWRHSKLMGLLS